MAESSASIIGSTVPGRYGESRARAELGELTIATAWNIQGKPDRAPFVDEVRRTFAIDLPLGANKTSRNDSMTALWLGPESWLLVAGNTPIPVTFSTARDTLNAAGGALFDVSASRVAYHVSGADASALLSRRCPLDFHPGAFAVQACAQSLLGHIGALYYRRSADAFVVMVARSFARVAWHDLCVSAAVDGYDVVSTEAFA